MRKRTPIFLVIAVVGVLVLWGSAVGYPTAVDDFDQHDGPTPSDTYVAPVTPIDDHTGTSPSLPTPPVVWWSVNFDFLITNLGIANTAYGTDLCPSLRIDSFTVNQELFISYLEGRIFKNQKLLWFNPTPHIPSAVSWAVHIEVYGDVIPFTASWDDTTTHQSSGSVFKISGSSGRVLISQPGTYIAEVTCLDIANGHMYGASSLSFVVANYWAGA